MRVLVDGRSLQSAERSGVGTYGVEILKATADIATDIVFEVLYTGSEKQLKFGPDFSNPRIQVNRVKMSNRLLMLGSRTNLIPLERFASRVPDAVWFIGETSGWTTLPTAMTIHDLSPHLFPSWYSFRHRLHYAMCNLKARAEDSERLFAVSAATAADLTREWHVKPERITVTPLGIDGERFRPREQPSDRSFRAAYDLNRPYLAALCTWEKRKNLSGLLSAYHLYRERGGTFALALLGGSGSEDKILKTLIAAHPWQQDIHITGFVPEPHKGALLRGAKALVFPSFFEGFGLPIIEAFASGTPVVMSTLAPHEEIALSLPQEAIVRVNPWDTGSIARGLLHLEHAHPIFAAAAAVASVSVRSTFTWTAGAKATAEGLRSLLTLDPLL